MSNIFLIMTDITGYSAEQCIAYAAIVAFSGGGNFAKPSHYAEIVDSSLADCRRVAALMRMVAREHRVELKFCKLLRAERLLDWAEKMGAKICMPAPEFREKK